MTKSGDLWYISPLSAERKWVKREQKSNVKCQNNSHLSNN